MNDEWIVRQNLSSMLWGMIENRPISVNESAFEGTGWWMKYERALNEKSKQMNTWANGLWWYARGAFVRGKDNQFWKGDRKKTPERKKKKKGKEKRKKKKKTFWINWAVLLDKQKWTWPLMKEKEKEKEGKKDEILQNRFFNRALSMSRAFGKKKDMMNDERKKVQIF